MTIDKTHDEVRDYYRSRATSTSLSEPSSVCCDTSSPATNDGKWGASRYDAKTLDEGPSAAVGLSMGCGNPYVVADLQPGETVLDLGSGGGLDVILSAKRVGPTGKAYGVDFLPEMLEISRTNAAEAGVENVEFLEGMIEELPLPDETVDVVISNCVINLAPDKSPVFTEIARVLRAGGRLAVSDVVAENGAVIADEGTAWAECGAGALHYDDYLAHVAAAGLTDASIQLTHEVGPGLHGAIVRASKPNPA